MSAEAARGVASPSGRTSADAAPRVGDRDLHAARTLADPTVRATLFGLGLVQAAYLVAFSEIAAPAVLAVWIVLSGAALIGVVFHQRVSKPVDGSVPRSQRTWQLLGGVLGVGALAPVLVVTVDVDLALFAPGFAAIAVAVLCTMPWRWRIAMGLWVVAVWLAALLGSGVRDASTLWLNLGGALLVVAATSRTSTALSDNLVGAERTRADAELRAGLLASLLRTNSLDPADVLRATVDGLVDLGFDMATIRELDHERGVARLIEGAARYDAELTVELPFGSLPVPALIEHGETLVLAAERGSGLTGPQGLTGLVQLPLYTGDELVAVVAAGHRSRRVGDAELVAAELLAAQAGGALLRARAYRADAETVEQLQQVDIRIHDFVSTVSHELRTPLTVVQGLGQTLRRRWEDLEPARRHDLLDRIDANAERLASMVRSLIDTSSFASGELEPHPEPTDLRAAVLTLLHRLVGVTSAHPVVVDIPENLVATVDPGLFQHVLENLLTNVAKHTPEGTRATITAMVRGERVEVAVHDDGPGIAPADLPHVLDRFYRGGDPDRRATSGLGLGLALAQQVVRAHGGVMEVTSSPGDGTRFSFDVPATVGAPR